MSWEKRGKEETLKEVFMRNIGVSTLEDVNDWFRKAYKNGYRIDNLKEAVEFAKQFKNKKVKIVGDFDCDGVTSTAILMLALKSAGFKDVSYRIPKRFSEGFGINDSIVDEVESGLIITCDNGIAQIDAIAKAKSKGISVIVLDHHMPVIENGELILPDADFIIDPHALKGSADFDGYCGAGLSYRFACEMLNYDKQICPKLLPIAAIGTIADVMELKEENYVFVRNGLKAMKYPASCTVGLYALISSMGNNITSTDIGFKIAPMINAASRMNDDGAKDGVELLLFEGPHTKAVYMVTRLDEINEQRKKAKKEGLSTALEIIEKDKMENDNPIVIYVPKIREGIVGIIAADLTEKYGVPAIVLTDSEKEGIIKGSGRSCGNYDMKLKLDEVSDILISYGGHPGAAGLSLNKESYEELKKRLILNNVGFKNEQSQELFYDLEIDAADIPEMIEELKKYEPFGEGNQKPIFKVNHFELVPKYGSYIKTLGTSGIKFFCKNSTAIGFDMIDKVDINNPPKEFTLFGTLSDNYFGGNVTHQVEFTDCI